jgi:hypothetical protein
MKKLTLRAILKAAERDDRSTLERAIVSPELGRIVTELEKRARRYRQPDRSATAGERLHLPAWLDERRQAILKEGLDRLDRAQIQEIVKSPRMLLHLRELALFEGGEHWERLIYPDRTVPLVGAGEAGDGPRPPTRRAGLRRSLGRMVAAMVLFGLGAWCAHALHEAADQQADRPLQAIQVELSLQDKLADAWRLREETEKRVQVLKDELQLALNNAQRQHQEAEDQVWVLRAQKAELRKQKDELQLALSDAQRRHQEALAQAEEYKRSAEANRPRLRTNAVFDFKADKPE